jgi:hypothetical protein
MNVTRNLGPWLCEGIYGRSFYGNVRGPVFRYPYSALVTDTGMSAPYKSRIINSSVSAEASEWKEQPSVVVLFGFNVL